MGQTAGQIENYIENKRGDLSSNLQELENKIKSAVDWRHQFRSHPMAFVGAAFGGGVLLGAVVNGSGGRRRTYSYGFPSPSADAHTSTGSRTPTTPSPTMDTALRAWDTIKGALVGIAATRVKDYMEEIIPGFTDQYKKAQGDYIR